MNLVEFQSKAVKIIDEIDSKLKCAHDKETTVIHLMEECGEIAREMYNEKTGRDKINIENLKEEFADVYLLLAKLADHYHINLEEAINKKCDVLKKRHGLN